MPRPSQENTILLAALQCFSEKGYDGTRIKHIAEKAGVTEGAIYRHFESKEAVAQALFSYYFLQYSEALQAVASSAMGVKERIFAFVQVTLQTYRENPAAFNFVLLRPTGFIPELPKGSLFPVEVIEKVLEEGQKEGFIRSGQPNLLAAILLGCVLRPIIVSIGSVPGALDIVGSTIHDDVIQEAAWGALKAE